ncbi:alpha/beta hydrolase [Ascidiimonas sp. W6]|uniref:alpha/beta hydrolase n=1 Tax=Ascidiimonas meishanensis TaxID=3128903 RepID=UPI0030EE7A46
MPQDIIHVYLMPGMAANPSIFENIQLPESRFVTHLLHWKVPFKGETIAEYASRMTQEIKHENPVLIGVSFGGMLVQEMSQHIKVKRLIIISSVKSRNELPKRIIFARYTKVHKLLPTGLVNNVELLSKYAFGEVVTKRLELYEKFLSIRDKSYIDWSLDQIINWKQDYPNPDVIHIHGNKDAVFPIVNISNHIEVEGGTHIMIINRYRWFNQHLPKLILKGAL